MRFEPEGDLAFQLNLLLNKGLDLFDNFRLPAELGVDTEFNQLGYDWPSEHENGVLLNDGDGTLEWTTLGDLGPLISHDSLNGLSDDDHTQYILHDGTRPFSGDVSHGGHDVAGIDVLTATSLEGVLITAVQPNVTTMLALVAVGALDAGSITDGFGEIDVGEGDSGDDIRGRDVYCRNLFSAGDALDGSISTDGSVTSSKRLNVGTSLVPDDIFLIGRMGAPSDTGGGITGNYAGFELYAMRLRYDRTEFLTKPVYFEQGIENDGDLYVGGDCEVVGQLIQSGSNADGSLGTDEPGFATGYDFETVRHIEANEFRYSLTNTEAQSVNEWPTWRTKFYRTTQEVPTDGDVAAYWAIAYQTSAGSWTSTDQGWLKWTVPAGGSSGGTLLLEIEAVEVDLPSTDVFTVDAATVVNFSAAESLILGASGFIVTFDGFLHWTTDNTYNIGDTSDNRPKTGYFGTSVVTPLVTATTLDGTLSTASQPNVTDLGVLTALIVGAPIFIVEQAAADADVAGRGQLWVKDTTPCELWFTDDAGTDTQIV